MTCTCLACMENNRPWRLGTAPWPSRGKIMTENNKTPFTLLYVIGACIAGISTSTPIDSSCSSFCWIHDNILNWILFDCETFYKNTCDSRN